VFHIAAWKDCYYRLDSERLVVGNGLIERSWLLDGGRLTSEGLTDKRQGRQWLNSGAAAETYRQSFSAESRIDSITADTAVDDRHGLSAEHWRIEFLLRCGALDAKLVVTLYPQLPVIRTAMLFRKNRGPRPAATTAQPASSPVSPASNLMLDTNNSERGMLPDDYVDALPLLLRHGRWQAAGFRDVTDTNNNLTSVESGLLYPNEKLSLRGNVLVVSDLLSGDGLTVVKESPTSCGQLNDCGADFQFIGPSIFVRGSGITADDLDVHSKNDAGDGFVQAYGSAVGVWSGGEYESMQWLHQYSLAQKPIVPDRDLFVMSNTWGDRSKDARICEPFILEELDAAAQLGITHLQIDDGWERGVTMNSVQASVSGGGQWGSYYEADAGFWSVHPERFPHSLHSVMQRANEYGIRVGLWFSPDATNDYGQWRHDADTLLGLHHTWGIDYFKLDGIHLCSKRGERNLTAMMDAVTEATGGKVYFNLDATADVRFGYFSDMPYGGIFLENRYTDWSNYYPHWTLRNLWQLARWMPAQRLQIEVLNVERNAQQYPNDPLAPAACGIVYSFAVALMSNPLMWMELSSLSDGAAAIMTKLIKRYLTYRDELLGGHILPIGEEPCGTRWTGFQSVIDASTGYILVFRELTEQQSSTMKLWNMPGGARLELQHILSSDTKHDAETRDFTFEEVTDHSGSLTFSLPAPFSFALYRYRQVPLLNLS
jgi:Alpha-galactosidase